MTGSIWTAEEAMEMLQLSKTMTIVEIAEYMGFPVDSVRGFIGYAVRKKLIKSPKRSQKKKYGKDPELKIDIVKVADDKLAELAIKYEDAKTSAYDSSVWTRAMWQAAQFQEKMWRDR